MTEFISQIAKIILDCRLDINSMQSSYKEYPEFTPHIGENYLTRPEKVLVISEVFSTKNSISDRNKDESLCSYVLNNKANSSCLNVQQALQNYDKDLTADNIALCFFIHKTELKVGSYRSNFSPNDLDDAINSLIPLINILKPNKIIFLGSQTKRTIERRSGAKVLNGKSFDQFLVDSSIRTDIIALRSSSREIKETAYDNESLELAKKIIDRFLTITVECIKRVNKEKKDFDDGTQRDVANKFSKEIDESLKFKECIESFQKTIQLYYDDALKNGLEHEKYIDDCVDLISRQIKIISTCLDYYQYSAEAMIDETQLSPKTIIFSELAVDSLRRIISQRKIILQRLLIPIQAIQNNPINRKENPVSSMSRKIEFVKDLVKELRPKNGDDPGQVMSLQMVAKRLNECDPPIKTALGKKYDDKGRGVAVLLRNVYNILKESSSQEGKGVAADMMHSFTTRPVAKVFLRTDDYVTKDEYWKPFKTEKNEEQQ